MRHDESSDTSGIVAVPIAVAFSEDGASLSYTDVFYSSPGMGHDHKAPLPLVLSLLPLTPVSFLLLEIASFTLYSCVLFVTARHSQSEPHHFQYHHYYHLSFLSPTANLPPHTLAYPRLATTRVLGVVRCSTAQISVCKASHTDIAQISTA